MDDIKMPKHPTHALRIIDNSDGEGDVFTILAFKSGDYFFIHDDGMPVIQYEGDEILKAWELSETNSTHL